MLYSLATVAALSATLYHAYRVNVYFFPTMVYLWSSKVNSHFSDFFFFFFFFFFLNPRHHQFSTLVLGNFGLWVLAAFGLGAKRLFLGELRAAELEMLTDNIRPTIMSLLFFLTIFRTNFNASFLSAVVLLLFFKAAHWVAEARVSSMESSPGDSNLTHVRLGVLIGLLFFIDQSIVVWAASWTYSGGPSLILLFGFEFCILAVSAASNMVMFALNLISIKQDQTWHAKGTYVLYLEFLASAVQSLVYLVFFFIIFRYYGLPLHIIRSMYLTFASFQRSLAKLLTYRRAVSQMNHRYPDASADELLNADSVCIVCREEMQAGKKLPCGHILHLECLRSWLQQDPTCPLCRKSVLVEELYRGDPVTYGAEYARFTNLQRNNVHHHQHQHQHQHYNPQQQVQQQHQQQQVHQQQQQQQQFHQHDQQFEESSSVHAEIEALRSQVDGMRSQLDFIQSLLIAQVEQQQQQQRKQEEERKFESPSTPHEDDLRAKRLQFFGSK